MVNERHLAHTEDHITFQDVDITLQMYFCRFNSRADLREAKPRCGTARSPTSTKCHYTCITADL
jgi:hypothetical protein